MAFLIRIRSQLKISLAIVLYCFSLPLLSQSPLRDSIPTKWSLERCLDHGLNNNLSIKEKEQQIRSKRIDLSAAKNQMLPALKILLKQNLYTDRTHVSAQDKKNIYSLSAADIGLDLNLFDGFQSMNRIKSSEFRLRAENENKKNEELILNLKIINAFVNILSDAEKTETAKSQKQLSNEQLSRVEELVKTGLNSRAKLVEMKAELAKDEAAFIEAKNRYYISKLDLIQLLDLELAIDSFHIDVSSLPKLSTSQAELQSCFEADDFLEHPSIKKKEYLIKTAQHEVKFARGLYLPKAQLQLAYTNQYAYLLNRARRASNSPLEEQLALNGKEILALSVAVPIFNRFYEKNRINKAKVELAIARIQLDDYKKELKKEIIQIQQRTLATKRKLEALKKAEEAAELNLEFSNELFAIGKTSIYELNIAKNNYYSAKIDAINAHYELTKNILFFKTIKESAQ